MKKEEALVHDNYLRFTETGVVFCLFVFLVIVWKLCGI